MFREKSNYQLLIPAVKLNATVKSLNYTDIVSDLLQRDQSRVKLYFVTVSFTQSPILSFSLSHFLEDLSLRRCRSPTEHVAHEMTKGDESRAFTRAAVSPDSGK